MIKTLIADDEPPARERLKDLLADHPQFQIVAEARNGSEALEQIVNLQPEVVFLDINMPGVSVFKTLSSLHTPPLIVFQTAHSQYATAAFDIDAVDYLMKPVSRERFARTVSKILEHRLKRAPAIATPTKTDQDTVEKISVRVQGTIKIIPIAEVYRISFEEGLSFIYTGSGRFLADHSLNHYQERLQAAGFFRSHRAHLVNLAFVTAIHKGFKGDYVIELKNGSRVDLSRRKAPPLKKKFGF